MHWAEALTIARNQQDLSYDEWCGLYLDPRPETVNKFQVKRALRVAHRVLVRNGVIDKSVRLSYDVSS